MKKKVLLGMSGGVDSSVAAMLLLEKGYDVTGLTLKLCPDEYDDNCSSEKVCCSIDDISDARRVAYKLGIDHLVMNFTEVFKKNVIDNFVNQYLEGKTPNPCIDCNKHIKFNVMLRRANELGFDYIATGHYANIEYSEKTKRFLLKKSKSSKDQTYVLYNLTQDQLPKILFPLGNLEKNQIREIAGKNSLHVASKPDSQEICFVKNNNYAEFIENYTKKRFTPGKFVDVNGNYLGMHKGIARYTLGQRRGLGIALGKHMYVTKIEHENNTITLSCESQRYIKTIIVENLNMIMVQKLEKKTESKVKIRHQSPAVDAVLEPIENDKIKVEFLEKQKITSSGQSAVFYSGDYVIGGGVIAYSELCK